MARPMNGLKMRTAAIGLATCGIPIPEARLNNGAIGFIRLELIVAVVVGSLIAFMGLLSAWRCESLWSSAEHVPLAQQGQNALEHFERQVRQVKRLAAYGPLAEPINTLVFHDYDDQPLIFTYNASQKQLHRAKGGLTNVFANNCDALQFALYQRSARRFTPEALAAGIGTNCRLVEVTWRSPNQSAASGSPTNSIVQSLSIAIRSR